MNPYNTLGIERGCTRDEVKTAFRAKAWHAHPDRGGDQQAFIECCNAYKQILREMPPRPREPKPAPAARRAQPPKPPKPKESPGRDRPRKPDRNRVRPTSPVANWTPDLVLTEDVGRDGQPAPPPDPQWRADLVLDGDECADSRSAQPRDPNWRPDFVLRDETAEATSDDYRSLFQRISARSNQDDSDSWAFILIRAIGILIFVALIAATIWLGWVAWTFDPTKAGDRNAIW
jgi:DnaJ domain